MLTQRPWVRIPLKPCKHLSGLIVIAYIAITTAMITPLFHLYVRSSQNIHTMIIVFKIIWWFDILKFIDFLTNCGAATSVGREKQKSGIKRVD